MNHDSSLPTRHAPLPARPRIVIGALSGWQHADRRTRCLSTWFVSARRAGMDPVFLMGVPELTEPVRVERAADVPSAARHYPLPAADCPMLFLPCPNGYEFLPQRTREFCRWAIEHDGWEYLLKCDDDTYVAADRLAAYPTAGRDYIGAEWRPGVQYGSGGAGYLLSRRAARVVAERLPRTTSLRGAEDLEVGRVLRLAGIPLSVEPRLIPYGNEQLRPRPENDLITAHAISAEVFLRIHAELA